MLRDLAALAPPLIVCVAFLVAVVMFLRRQMGAPGKPVEEPESANIHDAAGNSPAGDRSPDAEYDPGSR